MLVAEEIEKTVAELGIKLWSPRACSICNTPLYYVFENNRVIFDSNCDCIRGYSHPVERSYEDLAKLFNTQSDQNSNLDLWQDFKTNSLKET